MQSEPGLAACANQQAGVRQMAGTPSPVPEPAGAPQQEDPEPETILGP